MKKYPLETIQELPVAGQTAVLADIHGNSWALRVVLADMASLDIQNVIHLGDYFYGPLDPAGTARLLLASGGMAVLGNQDRLVLEHRNRETRNPTLGHVLRSLSSETFDWLAGLPATRYAGHRVLACHGTPCSDGMYLLEDIQTGHPRPRDTDTLAQVLNGVSADLILCGHSHLPGIRRTVQDQTIVNPGSVGLPAYADAAPVRHRMESGTPHATYAIVSPVDREWRIEWRRLSYDWKSAAAAARKNNRPDWAGYLENGMC